MVFPQYTGNARQNAWLIHCTESQIILTGNLIHRFYFKILEVRVKISERSASPADAGLQVSGNCHNIPDNGTCRGIHACTTPIEHDRVYEITGKPDGVEHTVHVGQGVISGYHRRMDTSLNTIPVKFSNGKQLDFESEFLCEVYVTG